MDNNLKDFVMIWSICALAFFLISCGATGVRAQPAPGAISFAGTFQNGQFTHKYFKTRDLLSVAECRTLAARIDAHLTTINGNTENTFVSSLGPHPTAFWIGLSDEIQEGQFRWDNGEPFAYTSWGTDFEPNDGTNRTPPTSEDYVELNAHRPGGWNDIDDAARHQGIIELAVRDLRIVSFQNISNPGNSISVAMQGVGARNQRIGFKVFDALLNQSGIYSETATIDNQGNWSLILPLTGPGAFIRAFYFDQPQVGDVIQTNIPNAARNNFDFDGDGRSDIAVFRPFNGVWYLDRSTQGQSATFFGIPTDDIVPADYDGDGKTDIAVFRDGFWYRLNSSTNLFEAVPFGLRNDVPVPGDYNGDGKADIAVFRSGVWYVRIDSQTTRYLYFGLALDKPVPADYDGDGKTDLAVFRRANGTWYLDRSLRGPFSIQFGLFSDKPVAGDYNGDGKADIAVWRPESGIWYKLGGDNFDTLSAFQFGQAGDIPVPADYDGDGTTDLAVWRTPTWYLQRTRDGFTAVNFGILNDKPVPAAFNP